MPSLPKVPPLQIFGPSREDDPKAKKGYRYSVSWKDLAGAHKRKTFGDLNSAKTYRQELEALQPAASPLDMRDYDGTLKWWGDLLGAIATRVATTSDDSARQNLKAIASAAMAARQIWDQTGVERELEELRKKVSEILSARQYGTRIIGSGPAAIGTAQ